MSNQISFDVVCFADGTIDHDGSRAAADKALQNYALAREGLDEAIGEAVNAVFDAHRGVRINMPALQSLALQQMEVSPENFKVMSEGVARYVRERADLHETKDKAGNVTQEAEPLRTREFYIGRGKGGGVCRWKDIPVEPAKK